MASRIDQMPQYRAQLPRSTHDLSHKFGFTATSAHLLPVFHTLMNPGEKLRVGFNFNLRTQPLASAAMVDLKVHTEYFFVPMHLLYQPFENMMYNTNSEFSSLYPNRDGNSQVVQDVFPVLDFEDVGTTLYSVRNSRSAYETSDGLIMGESIGQMYYRLMDMLDMNNAVGNQVPNRWNPNVFPYQLLAYHCIYQYYYRLDNRERFNPYTFNWDKFYNISLVSTGVSDLDATQVNLYDMFKIHYRPLESTYFTDVKVSPIVDSLNLNSSNTHFGDVQQWLSSTFATEAFNPNGNSSNFQIKTNFGLNGVDGAGSGSTGNADFSAVVSRVYNQGASFGDLSVTPLGVSSAGNYAQSGSANSVTNPNLYRIENPHTHSIDGSSNLSNVINTAALRAMFANEKLWSVTGRAKKNYDDQTLAHFGVKVPHDVKHQISCFGHDISEIHIGEVISTASTADAPLGEIAGKGYGQQHGNTHDFTAPCHGVIMVIMSIVPDITYQKTFGKYNVLTSRQDMFMPEYDHLGMQPLFLYETDPTLIADDRNIIVGWQYRYEQWKRRYNRVSRAFSDTGSLNSWMLGFRAAVGVADNEADANSYMSYMHVPNELNQIFLAQYPLTWSEAFDSDNTSIYDNDPFVVDSYISAKLVSTMSDYSLPRLDI